MDRLSTILMKKKRQGMLYNKSHLSAEPSLCLPAWLRAFCGRHLLSDIVNIYHAGDGTRYEKESNEKGSKVIVELLSIARFKMPYGSISPHCV